MHINTRAWDERRWQGWWSTSACRGPPSRLSPSSAVLPTPYTLHPTSSTLHPTPCTLLPPPSTLHSTIYTLLPTPYTLFPQKAHISL